MIAYIARTTLFKLATLFIISIVSFLIIHLAPGEPSQIDPLNPRFTKEDLARYRAAFDLDKPLPVQYWRFYKKFFTGELASLKDNQPVFGKIWRRFLVSLPLFIVGTLITWCLSFPLGIAGALRRYTFFDRSTTFLSYLMISTPGFFLAYVLIIAVVQGFPLPFTDYRVPGLEVSVLGIETFGRGGTSPLFRINDRIWHLVLPSLVGAIGGIAVLSRYVRGQMMEVVDSDFIRTARAKGVDENAVNYMHALRNAALPFVTMFGLILPGLIGGSVIIENIFAWPGMGRLGFEAVLARDYPVILSLNFMSAILVVIGTFISDVLLVVVDPRIRL